MPSTTTPRASTSTANMSADRRERKRKHDRDAQRIARERTRTRIKELEDLVQTLKAANAHPERMSELLAQVQDAREQNTKLQERMRKAAELLSVDPPSKNDESDHHLDDQAFPLSDDFPMPSAEKDGTHHFPESTLQTTGNATLDGGRGPPMFSTQLSQELTELQPYTYPSTGSELDAVLPTAMPLVTCEGMPSLGMEKANAHYECDPIADMALAILKDQNLEGRFWLLAGTILSYILHLAEGVMTPRALDDDITIRSCLEGWESVKKRYWLDAGWRWLRQLDERMYSHLSVPSRMAIMRTMRMKYLIQREPSRASRIAIPEFMNARPAQDRVEHERLIEHFVWPGVREHIIFSRNRYATNRFMENFRQNLCFAWPHDPHRAYQLDPESDLYSFTPLYIHHHSSIACWQMNPDFFQLFPELRADIPAAALSIPPSLSRDIDFELAEVVSVDGEHDSASGSSFQHHELAQVSNMASVV